MEHSHGGLEDEVHLEIGCTLNASLLGLGYTPAMASWQVPVTKWRKGPMVLGGVGMAKFDQPNWYVNFSRNGLYIGNPGTTYEEHPNVVWGKFDSMDFD